VQLAAVSGCSIEHEAAHFAVCESCRFYVELSGRFRGLATSGDATLGPAVDALLEELETAARLLFGRYRLQALLGRGGQGRVYRALDTETGETVAIKFVQAAGEHAHRSADEVINARRIRHPNIRRVFHTERHQSLRIIVMEFIDGPTLADVLTTLDRRAALRIFRDVCSAVAAAHDEGVLHLDLKPANVLLRGGTEPVVSDFGLSARMSAGRAAAAGGTPLFMPPEQRDGKPLDARADVHALGVILRHLTRARRGRLARVIAKATAESPLGRYPDAGSLLRAFESKPQPFFMNNVTAALLLVACALGALVAFRNQDTAVRRFENACVSEHRVLTLHAGTTDPQRN
jgi:serine/threonine protein kinase